MKRLIRNYLGRRALKRQRRSESLSDPRVAPSTKSTLRGAVDPVSERLARYREAAERLEQENRRLTATNMDQRVIIRYLRDEVRVRDEVRALKVEKHNAFLRELVEDEDLMTLLFAERPDLLERLRRVAF